MTYQLIRECERTAKKAHKCTWCGEGITVGDKYKYEVSTFDGIQLHHWHLECRDASGKFDWNESDGEFNPGEMVRGKPEWKDCQ